MKKTLVILILISLSFSLLANLENLRKNDPFLYHMLSFDELGKMDTIGRNFYETDPPVGPIHNIAEFEPMQAVLVRYPLGLPVSLIAEFSQETTVLTLVSSSSQSSCEASYQSAGVNMDNCEFLNIPTDSYWTRDYGPWFVIDGNDEFGIVNFPYNRPRPNDNDVPIEVADYLGINLFGMNLVHTGGNYMTDGLGISASTDLVETENPSLSEAEINQLVNDYLGIETYHLLDDPLGEYIEHIDCWGKFLAPDKVLIGQVPESDPRYDDYEALATYFAESTSSYGNSYEVHRVFTPGDYPNTPYTNSLILNDRVFVPLTGSQWDDEAIASYEEAMPGYEIVGVNYSSWENTDALHCRAKGIADLEMLYVQHMPILGEQPVQEEYPIEAYIKAYSGQPLYTDSLFVSYSVNGSDYTTIPLTLAEEYTYSAAIPAATEGSIIEYYLHAADQSGRSVNHPLIGAPDPHAFSIGLPAAPEIVVSAESFEFSAAVGETATDEFTIENTGDLELNYEISCNTDTITEYPYEIEDSPSPDSYDSNTFTEADWLEFEVTESAELDNIQLDYTWETDSWPQEGTFKLESPAGTEAVIASEQGNGTYSEVLDDFAGEEIQGIWKIWIEDSYGDGGHQATGITITYFIVEEGEPWLTVTPETGTLEPAGSETINVSADASSLEAGEYFAIITIHSNDEDEEFIEIPVTFTVEGTGNNNDVPQALDSISANYPNPFNPVTKIDYNLTKKGEIEISIYNVKGQMIKTLVKGVQEAGKHSVVWQGKDNSGKEVSSGIYFYKFKTEDIHQTRKMILMK